MLQTLCLCPVTPILETKTRVVVVMHVAERNKTSNTARLITNSLPNSETRYQGEREKPLDLSGLTSPERETWLLFPETGNPPMMPEQIAALTRPVTLIVPDGTWSQAKHIAAHITAQTGARRVTIPALGPSRYRLRIGQKPHHLCTLEAVARLLGMLESPRVQEELEKLLGIMVERVLFTRAKLPRGTTAQQLVAKR
jgi:DTW domain-containing protein YfiP